MSYVAPFLDETGLHISTYQDIMDYYLTSARDIFGTDLYLENDSQDYELLSLVAKAAAECHQALQHCYNARSPETAFGTTLDGLLSINGIRRQKASYSTATLVITGVPYTTITHGTVQDVNQELWDLNVENLIIPASGSISVDATCQKIGAITALANTITTINTPTAGWLSVTNPEAAVVGDVRESDAEAKSRRIKSVSLPSLTMSESLESNIWAVPGVQDALVYENDTSEVDERGFPPHSITVVVLGGSTQDIVNAIGKKKGLGVYPNGNVTGIYLDVYGNQRTMRFYRSRNLPIYVKLRLTPLAGYSSDVGELIKAAIKKYIDQFTIALPLRISQIWEAALSVSEDLKPTFSLKQAWATTGFTKTTVNYSGSITNGNTVKVDTETYTIASATSGSDITPEDLCTTLLSQGWATATYDSDTHQLNLIYENSDIGPLPPEVILEVSVGTGQPVGNVITTLGMDYTTEDLIPEYDQIITLDLDNITILTE